jgi:hypothetical protein
MSSKKSDTVQLARFREAAHDVEADTFDDALDRVFGRLDLAKKPEPEKGPDDPKAED